MLHERENTSLTQLSRVCKDPHNIHISMRADPWAITTTQLWAELCLAIIPECQLTPILSPIITSRDAHIIQTHLYILAQSAMPCHATKL